MGEEPGLNARAFVDPAALVDFLDALRRRGFRIGGAEYVAAQDLIVTLTVQGVPLGEDDHLERHLRPLLCKSAQEQEDFGTIIAAWRERLLPGRRSAGKARPAPPPSDLHAEIASAARAGRSWKRIAAGVLVAGIAITAATLWSVANRRWTVHVVTVPQGATVRLERSEREGPPGVGGATERPVDVVEAVRDTMLGVTPLRWLDVPPGTHELVITLDGYADTTRVAEVRAGPLSLFRRSRPEIDLVDTLRPLQRVLVSIGTDPEGADVHLEPLNSSLRGSVSADSSGRWFALEGVYSVSASLDGYEDLTQRDTLRPGRANSIHLELQRRPVGILSAATSPTGATIFIDSVETVTTASDGPVATKIDAGRRHVRARLDGYVELDSVITIDEHATRPIDWTLRPLPTFSLQVESAPDGASVWIDGERVGTTNFLSDVDSGPHAIRITLTGYEEFSESAFRVEADTSLLATLHTQRRPLRRVTFGADGRLAAGNADSTVVIWDVRGRSPLRAIPSSSMRLIRRRSERTPGATSPSGTAPPETSLGDASGGRGATTRPSIAPEQAPEAGTSRSWTLAVLPFQYLGTDTTLRALGQGVTDLLLTSLAQTNGLRVVERGALQRLLEEQRLSAAGRVDESTAVQVGRLLAADRVVLGRIVSVQGGLSLDAQVVDARTSEQLASVRTPPFAVDGIFDAVQDVTLSLLDRLGVELTEAERVRIRQIATAGARGVVATPDAVLGIEWPTLEGESADSSGSFSFQDLVQDVAVAPDGSRAAAPGEEGAVNLYAPGADPVGILSGNFVPIQSLAFSPDGRLLAHGDAAGGVWLWVAAPEPIHAWPAPRGPGATAAPEIAFDMSGGDTLAIAVQGVSAAWDVGSGASLHIRTTADSTKVTRVARGGPDWTRSAWLDGDSTDVLRRPGAPRAHAYSPDSSMLATVNEDGIRLWRHQDRGLVDALLMGAARGDDAGLKTAAKVDGASTVESIVFSPDGTLLAAADADSVRVWPVRPARVLAGDSGAVVGSGAFDSSIQSLAQGSGEAERYLWRIRLGSHNGAVTSLAFSPDGQRLASSSMDSTAIVWNVGAAVAQDTIRSGDAIESVAFSPDGTRLASAQADSVLIWDAGGSRLATVVGWLRTYWLAITPPLLLIVAGLVMVPLGWRRRADRFLGRRRTTEPPDLMNVTFAGLESPLFPEASLFRIAQRFRRRIQVDAPDLDPTGTVRATVDRAGVFTPVYARRQIPPEYLALIDRSTHGDQQARFIDDLLDRLVRDGVFVERYYFDRDARLCFPRDAQERPVALRRLTQRFPGHRLLLFADAETFFSRVTGRREAWTRQLLTWPERALLTPEIPERWGAREEALQDDFLVRHASPDGLLATADRDAKLERVGYEGSSFPFPPALRRRGARWLERDPVGPEELDETIAGLRGYLGEAGFYWLAACAVGPAMSWRLTLNLGYELRGEDGERLLDGERMLALSRLPWFRNDYMPDWLRDRLIDEMTPSQEAAVRGVFWSLLGTATLGHGNLSDLRVARDESRALGRIMSRVLERVRHEAPKDPQLNDYLFVSFMEEETAGRLAVRVGHAMTDVFNARRDGKASRRRPRVERARGIAAAVLPALVAVVIGSVWLWGAIPPEHAGVEITPVASLAVDTPIPQPEPPWDASPLLRFLLSVGPGLALLALMVGAGAKVVRPAARKLRAWVGGGVEAPGSLDSDVRGETPSPMRAPRLPRPKTLAFGIPALVVVAVLGWMTAGWLHLSGWLLWVVRSMLWILGGLMVGLRTFGRTLPRRVSLAAAIAAVLFLVALVVAAHREDAALRDEVNAAIEGVQDLSQPPGGVIGEAELQRLDALRRVTARLSRWENEGRPLRRFLLMYSGDELYPLARRAYFARLRTLMFSRAFEDVREQLASLPPEPTLDEYDRVYRSLKVYVEVTERPDQATGPFFGDVLTEHWAAGEDPDSLSRSLAKEQFAFLGSELPYGNPYDEAQNSGLVNTARSFLADNTNEASLYGSLLAQWNRLPPAILARDRPGTSGYLTGSPEVPGSFTRTGWDSVQTSLEATGDAASLDLHVVGTEFFDRLRARGFDPQTVAPHLEERYEQDYRDAWIGFLAGTHLDGRGLQSSGPWLTELGGNRSPIFQLLAYVDSQTSVDRPAVEAPFGALAGLLAPDTVQQIFSEASGRPYLLKVQTLAQGVGQLASQPGSPEASQAVRAASSDGLAFVRGIEVDFPTEPAPANRASEAVTALLAGPFRWADQQAGQGPQLAANQLAREFCSRQESRVLGRYPFHTGSPDASLQDVDALLKTDGEMQGFFRAAEGTGATLNPTYERFRTRANEIAEAFYQSGGASPGFPLQFQVRSFEGIDRVELRIDGSSRFYTPAQQDRQTFTWDAARAEQASLVVQSGDRREPLEFNGTWAIFRLFHQGNWSRPETARIA